MLPITFVMALATLKASAQNPDFLTLIKAATKPHGRLKNHYTLPKF